MSLHEQLEELRAEKDSLEQQQEKVAGLQSSLVEGLRQRAKELADSLPETIDVYGFGSYATQFHAVGQQWFDDQDRCVRRVVLHDDGCVYAAESSSMGYKFFRCSSQSELRSIPVKDIRRRFEPLFDE